jgi:hypothetical protein
LLKEKNETLKSRLASGEDEIKEYCMPLRNKIYLETEKRIERIHEMSDMLIVEVDDYEKECANAYNTAIEKKREVIGASVTEVDQIYSRLTLELDRTETEQKLIGTKEIKNSLFQVDLALSTLGSSTTKRPRSPTIADQAKHAQSKCLAKRKNQETMYRLHDNILLEQRDVRVGRKKADIENLYLRVNKLLSEKEAAKLEASIEKPQQQTASAEDQVFKLNAIDKAAYKNFKWFCKRALENSREDAKLYTSIPFCSNFTQRPCRSTRRSGKLRLKQKPRSAEKLLRRVRKKQKLPGFHSLKQQSRNRSCPC